MAAEGYQQSSRDVQMEGGKLFIQTDVNPQPGDAILDLGCGTGAVCDTCRLQTCRLADLHTCMNFRVEYVGPPSSRCLGREAAERATKSREVLRPAGTE